MEARMDARAFADAVAWTALAIPRRPAVPILAGMPLRIDGGDLTLSAFDYEQSRRTRVPVEAAGPDAEGATALVPGRFLADVAKSLPGGQVRIGFDAANLTLDCGAAHFALRTMPHEDYLALPAQPPVVGHVAGPALADAVARVEYATAQNEGSLPMLLSVIVEGSADRLTFWATDRYRIPVHEIGWEPSCADGTELDMMVLAASIREASKAMAGEAKVAVCYGGSTVGVLCLDAGWRTVTMRLPGETTHLAWRTHLDKCAKPSSATAFDVAALSQAVRRVGLCASGKGEAVSLAIGTGVIVVAAESADSGDAREEVKADLVGDPITLRIASHLLLPALASMGTPRADLLATTSRKPVLLRAVQAEDAPTAPYRHLIMPLRGQDS